MQFKYLIYLLCFLIMACSAATYSINIPSNIESKSYAIWYSDNDIHLPLLGGFEQSISPEQKAQLGLALLQGKRFAQCSYMNNNVKCTLASGLQSTKMQEIANNVGQIIAHILVTKNPLPLYWEKQSAQGSKQTFYNSQHKSQIQIEEIHE